VIWLRKPSDHPKHSLVQWLLLTRILIKPEYQVVRLFFNGQLALYGKQVAKSKVKKREAAFPFMMNPGEQHYT
jgi:hypothetical protein